jgi:formylglycine-generating enzyme required for sulfatase activity
MARIDAACIDRWEAHLVEHRPNGERPRHPHYLRPEPGVAYEAHSEPGVFPQAYISRDESAAACAAVGKRLCTRSEWQRACRHRGSGPAAGIYPYGDRWEANRCNDDKPHLLTLRFGADPSRWRYAQFNDPSLDQEPGFLAKTGAYAGCVGDLGVYDLVGNLHEWVSDTADRAFEARLRNEGITRSFQWWSPGNAVFMGGFYSTHGELGPGCTFTTIAHDAGYHDYSTGFRCCADAAH